MSQVKKAAQPIQNASSDPRTAGSSRINSAVGWLGRTGLVSRDHVLALVDQFVVSGTSFLATVLIARYGDSRQLGLYAVAISVLVTLQAMQESLVMLPYMIRKHDPVGTAAEHAGASLAASGILSATSVVVLFAVVIVLYAAGAPSESLALPLALICLVPFGLAREFARQYGFANLKLGQILAIDVVVTLVQVPVLVWLGATGRLTGMTACAALFAGYAVSTLGWLFFARAQFTVRMKSLLPNFSQSWALGKWFLAGQITVQTQAYITYWITIVVSGATVTGIYAACMSVVALSNPVMFGLGNLLTPRSVLAWNKEGGVGLLRQAMRDVVLLCLLMAAFCIVIFVAGNELMHLFYGGKEFAGHSHILFVLALANSMTAIGMPAMNGLTAMARARAIVTVKVVGAAVTVLLVTILISKWGLTGAAYGALAGSLVSVAARWIAFLALVPAPWKARLQFGMRSASWASPAE